MVRGSFGDDVFDEGFAEDVDVRFGGIRGGGGDGLGCGLGCGGQALGAHLDLLCAFLAGDIEGAETRVGEGDLEAEGTLADAGFAAYEHERTGDDAAAEETVDLGHSEGDAVFLAIVYLFELERFAGVFRCGSGGAGGTCCSGGGA